jgi:hypothetical protein
MGYFKIMAAIPGFFLSAFFLMLLWNYICASFSITGIPNIGYVQAMLVNITLWLAVAPLTAASWNKRK